jgi:hypothetical protein
VASDVGKVVGGRLHGIVLGGPLTIDNIDDLLEVLPAAIRASFERGPETSARRVVIDFAEFDVEGLRGLSRFVKGGGRWHHAVSVTTSN